VFYFQYEKEPYVPLLTLKYDKFCYRFTVLEYNGRGVIEQKWADSRILIRYAMVELRAKFKKGL
jgi:hypothetical protein